MLLKRLAERKAYQLVTQLIFGLAYTRAPKRVLMMLTTACWPLVSFALLASPRSLTPSARFEKILFQNQVLMLNNLVRLSRDSLSTHDFNSFPLIRSNVLVSSVDGGIIHLIHRTDLITIIVGLVRTLATLSNTKRLYILRTFYFGSIEDQFIELSREIGVEIEVHYITGPGAAHKLARWIKRKDGFVLNLVDIFDERGSVVSFLDRSITVRDGATHLAARLSSNHFAIETDATGYKLVRIDSSLQVILDQYNDDLHRSHATWANWLDHIFPNQAAERLRQIYDR